MKQSIRNMKIGKKMIVSYLIVCVLPLIIVSAIIYYVSAQKLEEASREFTSLFSSQVIENMDIFMDKYDRVTKSLLLDGEVISQVSQTEGLSVSEKINNQQQIRKLMMRLKMLEPEIQNIMFLTEQNILYSFNQSGETINQKVLEKQEWLKQMMDSEDALVISAAHDKAYYDGNQEEVIVTVGRIIWDYSGSRIGILLMDMSPSSIIKLSDGFLLAQEQYDIKISITDRYGGVLYDSDAASGRLDWSEVLTGKDHAESLKNEKDYIIFTEKAEWADLSVNAVIPKSTLLLKIENIRYVTWISVILSVVVVIVVSVLLSREIISPIHDLQKQMKLAENGDYQIMVSKSSGDEIGALVKSYNQMILKIKSLIEDVYVAEIKQKNAQYLALRTQINPHMLYMSWTTWITFCIYKISVSQRCSA